jgi:hypothetical protein
MNEAPLCALPHAISYANPVQAKPALLHVVRTRPAPNSFLRMAILQQLQELTLGIRLESGLNMS